MEENKLEELFNSYNKRNEMINGLEGAEKVSPFDVRQTYSEYKKQNISLRASLIKQTIADDALVVGERKFLTDDECEYVIKHHPLKAEVLSAFKMNVKTDDDKVIEVSFNFAPNPLAYSVMFLVAIFHLTSSDENITQTSSGFKDNRCHLEIGLNQVAYRIPFDKQNIPTTYFMENYHKYEWVNFNSEVANYVLRRWELTDTQFKNFERALFTIRKADGGFPFVVKPFVKAVDLRIKQIMNKEISPLHLEYFVEKMNFGNHKPTATERSEFEEQSEPYRKAILEYIPKAILRQQLGDDLKITTFKGKDGITRPNDPQITPFLQGKQGVGKSRFVAKLALGHAYELSNIVSKDQATVLARANAVVVELGEGTGIRKSDVASFKNAQTKTYDDINFKYENGLTRIYYQSILVGTVNNLDILKDTTGERRNYPIQVTREQVDSLDMDKLLTIYATLALDIMNGEVSPELFIEETEEFKNYKSEVFSQTDASLDILEDWLLEKLRKREIEYQLKDEYIILPNRRQLQAIINRDDYLASRRVYADKLIEKLGNLPDSNVSFKTRGKLKIKLNLKSLSRELTDKEDTLASILDGVNVLSPQDLLGMAVHQMMLSGVPRSEICERLAIKDAQIDSLDSIHFNPDWLKPKSQWQENDLPFM